MSQVLGDMDRGNGTHRWPRMTLEPQSQSPPPRPLPRTVKRQSNHERGVSPVLAFTLQRGVLRGKARSAAAETKQKAPRHLQRTRWFLKPCRDVSSPLGKGPPTRSLRGWRVVLSMYNN